MVIYMVGFCPFRRERVKRAKKEASKQAAKQEKDTKSEELKNDPTHASDESHLDTDKVVSSTTPPKRPDLKELTKGLPPGWQVLSMSYSNYVLRISFIFFDCRTVASSPRCQQE